MTIGSDNGFHVVVRNSSRPSCEPLDPHEQAQLSLSRWVEGAWNRGLESHPQVLTRITSGFFRELWPVPIITCVLLGSWHYGTWAGELRPRPPQRGFDANDTAQRSGELSFGST